MSTHPRPLGILGGMGPLASAEFLKTIYEHNLARREQDMPACLLLSDPTIPDRTEAIRNGTEQEVVARLEQGLACLCRCEVGPIVVPCITAQTVPARPRSTSNASPVSFDKVHFVVTTNLPLPVEVMASVALVNQKDDDVYIGKDGTKITLGQPKTEFDVAPVDVHDKPLPEGQYEAEVSYYPRWGAKKRRSEASYTEGVSKPFRLTSKSLTASQEKRRNEQRRWVMENVIIGTLGLSGGLLESLDHTRKYPATPSHLHDAFYFPGPDMTLIVNRLKGEVTVWRDGRASN